jgi:predicted deacylase
MAEVQKKSLKINVKEIREFNLPYWEIDSGKEGPCFLITAAQHGNEVMGCEIIRRFRKTAGDNLVRGKLLLLPFSNPPALWHRRTNINSLPCQPKRIPTWKYDKSLNSSWPGNPEGHEIEQLAFILNENIVKQATHNIDMHCWSHFSLTAALANDNNKKQIEFARSSALPAMRITKPPPAGVLSEQEKEGFPRTMTITGHFNSTGRLSFCVEFSGQYRLSEKEIAVGTRMLNNCSKYLGHFEGELEGMDEPVIYNDEHAEKNEVRAPIAGLFVERGFHPGDFVKEGDILGILFSDDNLEEMEIKAPRSGGLYTYGCHRRLSDVDLAAQHPYADKDDLLATIITAKSR